MGTSFIIPLAQSASGVLWGSGLYSNIMDFLLLKPFSPLRPVGNLSREPRSRETIGTSFIIPLAQSASGILDAILCLMSPYDLVVLGGGISGAGVVRDAAMRGLKTLLIEKGEPAQGTTANSSRLIHGGMRYLLYDRLTTHLTSWDSGHIVRIARPLLKRCPILWPVYREHTHGIENVETLLESYDVFQAMKLGKPHLRLGVQETLRCFPGIKKRDLVGSIAFDEWRVDPVALVLKNMESAQRYGAEIRSRTPVVEYRIENKRLSAVRIAPPEGKEVWIHAKMFVNATGPWVNATAQAVGLSIPLRLRQGIHLVYGNLGLSAGLLLEAEDRERYIFVLPVGEETLLGPTDIPCSSDPDALKPTSEEIQYLLRSVRRYFADFPQNYRSVTCGARPILSQDVDESLLSREYEVLDHESRDGLAGLITLGGGKMSSFRIMAEDVVDQVCAKLGRNEICRTHQETLDGSPVKSIPEHSLPSPAARRFMQQHPYIRKFHALTHLGLQAARHWVGKLAPTTPTPNFEQHYQLPTSPEDSP